MENKFELLIDNAIEKFDSVNVKVQGVLVCDKNGLALTNRGVDVSPGPIALLSELASGLSGRRVTVCLENVENQVLINQTEKAVIAIYHHL
ncbi:unnamed protein product [Didymodactylos carnosus]|uniref:Late endosomal/lysosomal adaptor and MAPK and MTOR activator 5 n=1 Tax=Didymodactylos carnosus TaxID=1234261 RepID=A0A813Z996_9BILA|nr:unnamed protein product [Didymodactylos carnosus]CAF3679477.1 unnamed protein product [Didymodactylos carnosus]